MTEYTLDLNGRRYKLNRSFRESLQERAKSAYDGNPRFSCWWSVANSDNYSDDVWESNIHENGDPVLVIETFGPVVPWDQLDQLEAEMTKSQPAESSDDDELEDIDSGNGMKSIPPENGPQHTNKEIFGRTHFAFPPHRFEEVPEPGSDDPDKIPPEPVEIGDDPEMVVWVPLHPDLEHTWDTGTAIVPVDSWVEWNVQQRANQPNIVKDKANCHDSFESLCRIHDCDVIGEYTPSNDIPEGVSGQVEQTGGEEFEEGLYGGNNWGV
jgi:hypothetical protein